MLRPRDPTAGGWSSKETHRENREGQKAKAKSCPLMYFLDILVS
jgi:hypothetical protein